MEIIDQDCSKTSDGTIFKKMLGDTEDKTVEEITEITGVMVTIEVGIDQEKGSFPRNYGNNRDRSSSNSRSSSGSRASTNRDRIRCYNCREYDHFARDCPTFREERDLEQLPQMLNLETEEQTHLLTSRQNNPMENYRTSPLIL